MREDLEVMFPLASARKYLLVGALVSLALGALAGIIAVALPDPPEWALQTAATAAIGGGAGLIAMVCLIAFDRARGQVTLQVIGVTGALATLCAMAIALAGVWEVDIFRSSEWPLRGFFASMVISGSVVLSALTISQEMSSRTEWVRTATLVVTYLCAAITAILILVSEGSQDAARLLTVLWILTAFGTTATPIVARLSNAEQKRRERTGRQSPR